MQKLAVHDYKSGESEASLKELLMPQAGLDRDEVRVILAPSSLNHNTVKPVKFQAESIK